MHELLRGSELDGPSEKDLARFAARMAPLVGLPLADLSPTSLPHGTAPADIAPSSFGGAAARTSTAKVAGSFALKAWMAVGVVGLGLGVWWAGQGRQAAPAVEAPRAAVPALVTPSDPHPSTPSAPVMETSEVVAKPATLEAPARQRQPAATRPDELSLIAQAQSLRSDPRALLKVLKLHASLYPRGMLAQEREVLAVEALIASGQLEAGKRRAAQLEADYPQSAHLPRIHALLEKARAE
jgi:hypothetical protein